MNENAPPLPRGPNAEIDFTAVKTEAPVEERLKAGNPESYAKRFLKHRAASVGESVTSGVVLVEALAACEGDRDKSKRLLEQLAKAKALSKVEAAQGLSGKKTNVTMISKLRKIAEHAELIRHPRVLPFLQPGYSVLYELGLLYEDLGSAKDAVEVLHEILVSCEGQVTRKWLGDIRAKLRDDGPSTQAPNPQAESDQGALVGQSDRDQMPETDGELIESSRAQAAAAANPRPPITALLATPGWRDASNLGKAYLEQGQPTCLSLGNEIGDHAVLFVYAKVGALLSIATAIGWWKFKRCSHVYLLSEQESPDVIESDALAIYERGEFRLSRVLADPPAEKDPVTYVNSLLQGVSGRRVHLFADSATPGWESIIGDMNWAIGGDGA
jgi:hypothetical protein